MSTRCESNNSQIPSKEIWKKTCSRQLSVMQFKMLENLHNWSSSLRKCTITKEHNLNIRLGKSTEENDKLAMGNPIRI